MLLIEIAIALSINVEDHISGTVAAASESLSIHAVTVDRAFREFTEEVLILTTLTSVQLQGHLADELGAAGEHN